MRTRSYTVVNSDELKRALTCMRQRIETILDMTLEQSGFMIAKVSEIHGVYSKYNPTRAGKYIKLPLLISLKKACISIKDQEDKCFKYAVQRGFLKIDENSHPTNVCHYKKTKDVLNFEAINFPANNHEVDKFEEINDIVSVMLL